jgi:hypothetical protein
VTDDARSDHEEILRLRDRFHTMEKTVTGLTWRIEQLEELEPKINEVVLAQRVTAGVKAAIEESASASSAQGITRWQKIGIAVAASTGVVSTLVSIVVAAHGGL